MVAFFIAVGRRLLRELLRFERWIASNSSSERPEPTATQVSGDSARCAGIWVSSRRRSSMPCSSEPPPASMMPRSMMSDASSGGVRSSVSLMASMICTSGSSSAARTSSEVSTTVLGSPDTRSRPRISAWTSSSSG